MDQARNYVCRECSTAVPSGHKFCGTCGAAVPADIVELRVRYFGTMQTPGKARLILIRGEGGVDGLSYMLQGTEHVTGREDGQILFPEDSWLSARHANFVYENGKLVVRDENSHNGVFVRVRDRASIQFGEQFLCGEQLFRVEAAPEVGDTTPGADSTYFYASPRKNYSFRVVQILRGGSDGLVHCAATPSVTIGREDCDINFPLDVYMSGKHARIEVDGNDVTLIDEGSKNGTYVRIDKRRELEHGDYVFIGKQLLRVEVTA